MPLTKQRWGRWIHQPLNSKILISPPERNSNYLRSIAFLFVEQDSYKLMQAGMLSDARFLQSIFAFSQNEKDFINDETVELMAPYLELDGFNPAVARNASKAAEGLCTWCRAMTYYHEASKVGVKLWLKR